MAHPDLRSANALRRRCLRFRRVFVGGDTNDPPDGVCCPRCFASGANPSLVEFVGNDTIGLPLRDQSPDEWGEVPRAGFAASPPCQCAQLLAARRKATVNISLWLS